MVEEGRKRTASHANCDAEAGPEPSSAKRPKSRCFSAGRAQGPRTNDQDHVTSHNSPRHETCPTRLKGRGRGGRLLELQLVAGRISYNPSSVPRRFACHRGGRYVQTVDFSACQAIAGATNVERSYSRGPYESVLSIPRLRRCVTGRGRPTGRFIQRYRSPVLYT